MNGDGGATTSPERWHRASEIFADALEQTVGPARDAFLLAACGGDDGLIQQVRALIAAEDNPRDSLRLTRFAHGLTGIDGVADTPESWMGRRLGNYRIVSEIARGGMGLVFKGHRDDAEFNKDVAIKLVRDVVPAGGGARLVERFKAERQILATLDHPNIARLIDGGTTAEGWPFLVMEFVDGEPITDYADRNSLDLDARLQLFRAVCAAVHFAHQRLVVHRDLKPSNIFVSREGVVKLLDFGIAKMLEASPAADGDGAAAGTTLLAMTPAYASPEQIKGETITTASDVYALGVVLYELLTGQSPYKSKKTQPLALAREICETDPERPSTVVGRTSAAERGGSGSAETTPHILNAAALKRFRRGLRGDLDNIVLMALRKDPARRYASAEQMAEDVRRYAADLPVIARADTFSYRTAKFVSRNRWAVSLSIIALAAMTGAFAVALHQAHEARVAQARAERHFSDIRTLVNGFIFKFFEQLQEIPGTRSIQREMVDTGAEYLSALARDAANDPALALEAAKGFLNLAKVQSRDLADARSQAALLKRALGLIGQATANGADAPTRIQLELSARTELFAALVNAGDVATATAERTAAVSLARAASGYPDKSALQLARADTLIEAARLGAVVAPAAERWTLAQEALAIHQTLAPREFDADARWEADEKRAIATLYAAVVASDNAPADIAKATARTLIDRAVLAFEAQVRARPGQVRSLANLAFATSMAAELAREGGDIEAARQGFRRSREHAQTLARLEPNLAQAKLNSIGAAMAELEMELAARTDPAVLFQLVEATLAEAAALPASLASERPGVAVKVGLSALASEVKLRWCAAPNAPGASACARMLVEAVEGFREANRLLPQIEDMIQRDNGEMLQLLKTGVGRAEAAMASPGQRGDADESRRTGRR
jgi:serine/threonine protein kinase